MLTDEENKKAQVLIYTELNEVFKKSHPHISASWKCKLVARNYAFEMPLPHGEHKFLKVKYPATIKPLPSDFRGNTFECVFGAN